MAEENEEDAENAAENDIKLLLSGVIPEREAEMKEYLEKYSPHFSRCDDRSGFIIEAGGFGILKFTQRTMHQMWLLGFAAQQSLNSYSTTLICSSGKLDINQLNKIPDQLEEENKYKRLINAIYELAEVSDPTTFLWLDTVPNPTKGKPTDIEEGVTFDLICMATAYVFLHEIKHIIFRSDNNAPISPNEEELKCDLFARSMMFDRLDNYSKQSGYDLTKLKSKRAMGISLALFFILVITPLKCWSGTRSHPSIATRIESMLCDLQIADNDNFWLYVASLFLSHLKYLNNCPSTIKFNSFRELAMILVKKIENVANAER